MFLMTFVVILVVIFNYLPRFSSQISQFVSQYVFKVSDEEMNLRLQVKDIKAEQASISMTEEFAKYAKMQRKIEKYMAEIKTKTSARSQQMTMLTYGIKVSIYVLQAITMISLILSYRNEPLLQFPAEWFYPVQKFVAFPTGIPGAVGMTCWIIISGATVRRFLPLVQVPSK